VAVVVLTIDYGHLPWIALLLAFSFGTYGLLKKLLDMGAVESLTVETALLTPVAMVYLLYLLVTSQSSWTTDGPSMTLLLASTGLVTVVPLLLFGAAATRIPLTWIGLLQYTTPVLQFAIGVFILDEPMPASRWIGFALVWSALVVLAVDSLVAIHRGRSLAALELEEQASEAH
jgi:chloramphenicol-sensitive protein RarD